MPSVSRIHRPLLVVAEVVWEGETINIQFDRNRVTLNWVAKVQRALEDASADAFGEATADVIHGWDITNEDGSPYPPTAEHIGELPAALLGELFDAIQTAGTPGAAEGNASANISTSATPDFVAAPEAPQNGRESSASPTPSESLPTR